MSSKSLIHAQKLLTTIPQCIRALRKELGQHSNSQLTVPQLRVLIRLSEGPTTNLEIAEWMGVKAPTMCRMIQPLEKRGFLKKSATTDKRKISLVLTSKGKAELDKALSKVHERLADKISQLSQLQISELEKGVQVLEALFS